MAAGAILGGLAAGGGAVLAGVIATPAIAATTFVTSYFFGWGMLLGERQMYQDDWPRIKKELDEGRPFNEVMEKYVTKNTTTVTAMAKQIFEHTSYFMKKEIMQSVNAILGAKDPGDIGFDINPNLDPNKFNPPDAFPSRTEIKKEKKSTKTEKQILVENQTVKKHIEKVTVDPLMVAYTKFLADLSMWNQVIAQRKANNRSAALMKQARDKKESVVTKFNAWKRNNKRWMIEKGFT